MAANGADTLVTGGQDNTATAVAKGDQTQTQDQNKTQDQTQDQNKTQDQTQDQNKEGGTLVTDGETKTEPKAEETKTVPESYDFKLPEGFEIDAEAMETFTSLAKSDKLSQEQAQKYLDLAAEMLKKQIDSQTKLLNDLGEEWKVKVQKEYGDKLSGELVFVARARDSFAKEHPEAGTELNALLRDSKLGNHPAVFKLFAWAGRLISEDNLESGKSGVQTGDPRDLYPNSNMNP